MKQIRLHSMMTLVAAIAVSQLGYSEVKTIEQPETLAVVEQIKARDTSSLRCWQYGELLFEETHLTEKLSMTGDSTLVFKAGSQEFNTLEEVRELHLINAGSATCLYEKI